MARLPRIEAERVVTPQIQSSVSGADVARASPFAVLAGIAGIAGQRITANAEQYQRGVELGVTTSELELAKTDALRIANEANGDPELFAEAWRQRTDDRLSKIPPQHRDAIAPKFMEIGGGYERSIMADTMTRDRKLASDRIEARQATLLGELTDLARAGAWDTPEYQERNEEYASLVSERLNNPFFAYSKERAELDLGTVEDTLIGARVTGELETIYAEEGEAAAKKRAQEFYNDDSDGLDRVAKLKAIKAGLGSIKSMAENDAQSRREYGVVVGEAVAGIKEGRLDPFDPIVDELIAQADVVGDPARKLRLIEARQIAVLVHPLQSMSLPEQMDYIRSGGQPGTVDLGRAASAISSIESGGNYGALGPETKGDRAYGKYQVMGANIPSWTREALGREMTAQEFLASPEAQDAVFAHRFGLYVQKYGNVQDAASAWFTGRPLAQGANAKDVLGTSGADYVAKFTAAFGGGGGSAMDGYVKGVLPGVRAEIKTGLTSAITAAGDMLNHDRPLDGDQIGDLIDAARIVDDAAMYDKVGELLVRSATVSEMTGTPVPQMGAAIDQLRAPGPRGEEALRLAALDQAIQTQNRMRTLLNDDPRALGVQLGLFQPGPTVDFANIGDAPAILSSRVPEMEMLAAAQHVGPLSVLRPGEADSLKAAWEAGDPNQRLGLLAALTQALPPDTLMATLSAFSDKADTQMLAIAGGLYATNPEAGTAVVRGLEAMKVNPKFAYDTGDEGERTTREEIFPPTVVAPEMVGAWQPHLKAAEAVYADMSARAGDVSGKFKEDRFTQAVDVVTGGLVEFNGGKTISPEGIDQQRFDEIMAGLPEWALGGAVTPDGTPVTGDFVRRFGRLQGYGDGRYVIALGDTGVYAMGSQREAGIGGPFILDIRPFKDGVYRQSAEQRYRSEAMRQGVTGPALDTLMDVYRRPANALSEAQADYQRATGAGNTAPPPLGP